MKEDKLKEYNEVLAVLGTISEEEYFKIPKKEIEFFESHKLDNVSIDMDNISKEAYTIITDLYLKYIANAEETKIIKDLLILNSKNNILKNDSNDDK